MASTTAPPPAFGVPGREGPLPVPAGSEGAAACGGRLWRAFRPPPGPRRTPDHPPYAEMIQVALRVLAEGGGSTVEAISRRIAADYIDLPWAHERLLPHYLRRVVASGEVAVAAPGRYALISPSPGPAGDAKPNPDPDPKPSPCSRSTSCPIPPDGPPAATPRSSSSSATATVVDDGAGEGLGGQTLAVVLAAASSRGDGKSQRDRPSLPATAASHRADKERLSVPDHTSATALVVHKGRSFEDDRPSGSVAGHFTCFLESKSSEKKGSCIPPLRRRGRGRPPKSAAYHWELSSGTRISDPGGGGNLLTKSGKSLSPNSFILSMREQGCLPKFIPSVFPRKKRGRPRKCKPTEVTSDAISIDDDADLMNVANSDVPKDAKLGRDAHSSWSLGDGASSVRGKVSSNCGAAPRLKVVLHLPSKPECSRANDSSTPDLSLLAGQVAVHVPKRPRTSIDHKPRKIGTTLFEEKVSDGPPIQSSEEVVCALPATRQDPLPNNFVSNQPPIEGWVQVLLAVQPTTADVRHSKGKKNKRHCSERKLVHPTVRCRRDNFLRNRQVENVAQMGVWLQTSMTRQFNSDDLLESKTDENREEIERCMQLIAALTLDPNVSSLTTEEGDLSHVGRGDESMSDTPFHAMEEENGAHDEEKGQSHSVLDGCLQTGKEECRAQPGGYIKLLPPKQFTPAVLLQISMENVANTEGLMQLLATGLSRTEDSLQGEERIRLHGEIPVLKLPEKQLMNKEMENKPQDDGSIQDLPVEHSSLEDDLQAAKVNLNSERCLQVLPTKSGDDLQTEYVGKPSCVEFQVTSSEPPTNQAVRKELENKPHDEESIQEFPVEQSGPEDDLQAEEVNGSDSKRCLHMPFKFGDDLRTEDMREPPSVEVLLACTAEQYAPGDSLHSKEVDDRPWVEESIQEVHVQHFKPLDDIRSEEENESDAGQCCVKMLPYEQAKLKDGLSFEKDKNGTCASGCVIELLAKESSNADSSLMHQLQEGSHDEFFNQKFSVEQKSPESELQTERNGQLYAGKHVQVLDKEQPKLGVDLLSEAGENGRYAKGYAPALPERGPMHQYSLQAQKIDNRSHHVEFTQEITTDECLTKDDLQRRDRVSSHMDERLQVIRQEQHMPGDDPQMEDRSTGHAEEHALLLPLEKSMVCDFVQMSESGNNTQTVEGIQNPPLDLSMPEDPLQNGLHNDSFLEDPGMELSKTCHPLQLKVEKGVLSKKNRKRPRKMWFEG